MGAVVGGFLMPHDPMIFTNPEAADSQVRERVLGAYAEASRRIVALDPTTLIIIGTDHYVLFGPGCLPQALIATGDLEGPLERLPGMPRQTLPDNGPLARHLAHHGHMNGVDWAVAHSLTVDHSVAIPYFMVGAEAGLPLVPVYLACGVEPLIPLRRAAAIGTSIRDAVESWDDSERVVVIGSGGISHWVGTAEMGRVSESFDRRVLGLVCDGDVDALSRYTDEEIVAQGGNGALELRNFLAAMTAVGAVGGEVIAYEPVEEWITGLGFVELLPLGHSVGSV